MFIEFFQNRFAFLLADCVRFPDKLILFVIDISEVGFDCIDEVLKDDEEVFVLIVAILILSKDH